MYNNWASKRYSRSVKELCLWGDNPRLDPEQEYKYLRDYFDNIVTDSSDKQNFMNLVKSIAEKGFISIDPIVTYKDNNRLIVAEGNRRVLALKILLEPQKSPIKYRKQIKIQSDKIKDKSIISKIPVIIAPSFDDTVWYINERNSISTLKQSWSRIQQHQWYYDEYMRRNKNIEEVANDFNMTKSELENIIRFVKIRNLIKREEVKEILTNKEYKMAIAINFPITILERFFSSAIVQEKWGINFDGENLKIKNNKDFMGAFKYLIKNIVSKDTTIKIDTRTVTSSLDKILDHLPKVDTNIEGYNDSNINHYKNLVSKTSYNTQSASNNSSPSRAITTIDDIKRARVIKGYSVITKNYRLLSVFNELKHIPTVKYPNAVAALLRVLLDLSVAEYIQDNSIENTNNRSLKEKLKEINKNLNNKHIDQFLNPKNETSLDSLNMYIHDIKNINISINFFK